MYVKLKICVDHTGFRLQWNPLTKSRGIQSATEFNEKDLSAGVQTDSSSTRPDVQDPPTPTDHRKYGRTLHVASQCPLGTASRNSIPYSRRSRLTTVDMRCCRSIGCTIGFPWRPPKVLNCLLTCEVDECRPKADAQ